jgi:hypothetical protein
MASGHFSRFYHVEPITSGTLGNRGTMEGFHVIGQEPDRTHHSPCVAEHAVR